MLIACLHKHSTSNYKTKILSIESSHFYHPDYHSEGCHSRLVSNFCAGNAPANSKRPHCSRGTILYMTSVIRALVPPGFTPTRPLRRADNLHKLKSTSHTHTSYPRLYASTTHFVPTTISKRVPNNYLRTHFQKTQHKTRDTTLHSRAPYIRLQPEWSSHRTPPTI